MAVRELDEAGSDNIVASPGALSGMTSGTIAVLVERTAATSGDALFVTHDSGGSLGIYIQWTQFGDLEYGQNFNAVSIGGQGSTGVWRLIVVRKASGTATPRFSVYDYSNTTWTHSDANGTNGDPGAPGAGGTIDFNAAGNYPAARVAARAAWSNTVKWSADSTGDSAIQAAGLHTALSNWVTAAPSALWRYNQASTATAVTDLTGGGAGQTSLVGTTVVTGDDPPGFDFTLGTNASAGAATGTGAALTPQAAVSATAGAATGTGAALGATGNVTQLSSIAAGTGTAYGPTANITQPAGAAAGAGTAYGASANLAASAGVAAGAGAARGATGNLTQPAGTASGAGAAYNATGGVDGAVTAGPGVASGTGTAHAVTANIVAAAGRASGTGVAYGAAVPSETEPFGRWHAGGVTRNGRWMSTATRPGRWSAGVPVGTDR